MPQTVCAQTIQLPEVRRFASGSSYLIPDRGAIYGGGVLRRSESSGSVRTPFRLGERSLSASSGATQTIISATIHPSADEYYGIDPYSLSPNKAGTSTKLSGANSPPSSGGSLAAIRRQLSAADAMANQQAIKYVDKAEACLKQGKTNIAKLFFRTAISSARGDFRAELERRLAHIENASQSVQRRPLRQR
ncbi:MAG: hypothetical protein ACIALR_09300 [Blastopirellula sp. JB062]